MPTRGGIPAEGPFPALFKYTPYLRTFTVFDKRGNNILAELFDIADSDLIRPGIPTRSRPR